MKDIADLFRVTMDSAVERAMIVHTGDGSFMKFRECGDGLYYFDTQNDQIESFDTTDSCSATDDYTHIVSDAENSDSHEEEMDTTVGHNEIKQTVQGYSFLSTVEANKEHFHRDEIEGVDRARTLQHSLDWPSLQHFREIVAENQLINCAVTLDDIARVEAIYGSAVPILKGKMTRRLQHKNISMQR